MIIGIDWPIGMRANSDKLGWMSLKTRPTGRFWTYIHPSMNSSAPQESHLQAITSKVWSRFLASTISGLQSWSYGNHLVNKQQGCLMSPSSWKMFLDCFFSPSFFPAIEMLWSGQNATACDFYGHFFCTVTLRSALSRFQKHPLFVPESSRIRLSSSTLYRVLERSTTLTLLRTGSSGPGSGHQTTYTRVPHHVFCWNFYFLMYTLGRFGCLHEDLLSPLLEYIPKVTSIVVSMHLPLL